MGASGVGTLYFFDGVMGHKQYINILKTNLHTSAEKMGIEQDFVFMQNNDPKNTAFNTRLWILFNTPKYMETPPQSRGIIPIENL